MNPKIVFLSPHFHISEEEDKEEGNEEGGGEGGIRQRRKGNRKSDIAALPKTHLSKKSTSKSVFFCLPVVKNLTKDLNSLICLQI